ncbi:aldehyde dehydrogenase family protein, partial [Myxococcota bacterium]
MSGNVLPEVKEHYGRVKNYIDGEWVESKSARTQEVVNPATGKPIAEVPMSTVAEVEAAVSAAEEVFEEWRETPPNIRVQPLYRLKVLFE